jgi:hypothetical protein
MALTNACTMMNFAERIKSLVARKATESEISPDYTPLDFVKARKGILKKRLY